MLTDPQNKTSRKQEILTAEKFILFNLAFVFIVAVIVHLPNLFPQIKPLTRTAQGQSAFSTAKSQPPSRLAQQWKGGAQRRQIEQLQYDFIQQTEQTAISSRVAYNQIPAPLLKQSSYQHPIKAALREDCYFDCSLQDSRNDQYCQTRCTY